MRAAGDSCPSCVALQTQVAHLQAEVTRWKITCAYLAGIIDRITRYARGTQHAMGLKIRQGDLAPAYFNFARGAEAVAWKVTELVDDG